MEITTTSQVLSADLLKGGLSFETYWQASQDLFAMGRSTSALDHYNTPAMLDYVKLNLARSRRVLATTKLSAELLDALANVNKPQRWVLLSESWCGDASQLVPVIHLMAKQNPNIALEIFLRDKHPELMEQLLTNGTRSIPKLAVLDAKTNEVLGTWGPRPASAQAIILLSKAEGMTHDQYVEKVHAWYAADKTQSTQAEFAALLGEWTAAQAS